MIIRKKVFTFVAGKYPKMKNLMLNIYWWRNLQPEKS